MATSRQIAENVHWIQYCFTLGTETVPGGGTSAPREVDKHAAQNAFLISDERTLLFETGPVLGRADLMAELERLLDGRPLDYLAISHTDSPHCANTWHILEAYPECTLLAPDYGQPDELYFLGDGEPITAGDTLDLGGTTVEFCEAVFLDAAKSVWMYERETGGLFPADWIGFTHHEGECLRFVDEYADVVDFEVLKRFHARVFYWFRYVDVDRVVADVDWLYERYRPSYLAPSHGQVIREQIPEHFEMLSRLVAEIREEGPGVGAA